VKVNRLGQTSIEIFNFTNSVMTIEKDSLLGIIERISDQDGIGKLNVSEMTVNLEKLELLPANKLTKDKNKYISENAKLNVPEEFKQKYMDLLMKHHEVTSDSKK
jgi:hypothetical protein